MMVAVVLLAAVTATIVVELATEHAEIATAGLPPYLGSDAANLLHNMEHILRIT